MAGRMLQLVLLVVFQVAARASECLNTPPKTKCYEAVMHAMLHGFAQNPKNFPGLSVRSTFTDFQAFFHNALMHSCPRPCMEQEEPCVTFGPDYSGMGDVKWVKEVGVVKHPEWYPELPYPATDREIASVLYTHGIQTCLRPCDPGEEEGHFVPVANAPVYAESEGWLTSTTITKTGTRTSVTTISRTTIVTTPPPTTETVPPPSWMDDTAVEVPAPQSAEAEASSQIATTGRISEPPAAEPATEPPSTQPPRTEPPTTGPPATAPATTEPAATAPASTAPATTEPATTVPAATEPATTEPITTVPATTEPATTEPVTTVPATTEPATTEPATTVPAATEPATTEPATTVPATTKPATTVPATTEPPATQAQTTAQPATEAPTTEPTTAPTTELPATAPPSSTPSPTEAPTSQPATSTAAAQEENCHKSGKSLVPMDAVGVLPVSLDSIKECQAHCHSAKSNADIGHFLYYEPFRTCHCAPLAAAEVPAGPEFVSGPLSCDIVLDDASIELPASGALASRAPVMTAIGALAVGAVAAAGTFALRRRSLASASALSPDSESLLDEESMGLEFSRTWPDSDFAVE